MIAHLLCAALAGAQLQLARVEGSVLDAQGAAIAGTLVGLDDPLGGTLRSRTTDTAGRFAFPDVAPGRYTLRAVVPGADPILFPLAIDGALPIDVTLRLPPRLTGTVVVEAPLVRDSITSRASVAGASVGLVPVRVRARGLQELVATLPGWATEDNGLVHVRGVDDGFLYVIDGVPVYERIDQLSGVGPDLSSVESVNVVTGYIPAEFGHKAGGVIEVRTRTAPSDWQTETEIEQTIGEGTGGGVSTGGALGRAATLRLGVSGQRSDRFLDPVHPDNLHNAGRSASTFGQLRWTTGGRDRLSASWGIGGSHFDVPNTDVQEAARQDQQQAMSQAFLNASWQRAWTPATVSQVSAYSRRSDARLTGSASDTPLFANADRSFVRTGAIGAVTHQRGSHLVKAGAELQRLQLVEAFSFAVTDDDAAEDAGFSDAAIAFGRNEPFQFAGRASRPLWSFFVQDEWQPASRLTLSVGLRFDRSNLLLTRHQWSPRVGAAYRLGARTVARGSISRFFQPPQPENLLLSSSGAARAVSPFGGDGQDGGADVEPERQWAFEAGLEHWIGQRVRVDAAYWHRAIREVADPNVFAGTTIIFPNAVARGRARGLDVRVELPRQRGWSAYMNAAVAQVIQTGPITGGLFLEEEIGDIGAGTEFVPDHDQRLVLSGGLSWTPARSGLMIALTGRYESGAPIPREEGAEDDLAQRPGAELVDFDRGRVAPRTVISLAGDVPIWRSLARAVRLRASALNLFDKAYAYNFGNPFSGTHFGAPRTVSVGLRAVF